MQQYDKYLIQSDLNNEENVWYCYLNKEKQTTVLIKKTYLVNVKCTMSKFRRKIC